MATHELRVSRVPFCHHAPPPHATGQPRFLSRLGPGVRGVGSLQLSLSSHSVAPLGIPAPLSDVPSLRDARRTGMVQVFPRASLPERRLAGGGSGPALHRQKECRFPGQGAGMPKTHAATEDVPGDLLALLTARGSAPRQAPAGAPAVALGNFGSHLSPQACFLTYKTDPEAPVPPGAVVGAAPEPGPRPRAPVVTTEVSSFSPAHRPGTGAALRQDNLTPRTNLTGLFALRAVMVAGRGLPGAPGARGSGGEAFLEQPGQTFQGKGYFSKRCGPLATYFSIQAVTPICLAVHRWTAVHVLPSPVTGMNSRMRVEGPQTWQRVCN